MKNFFLAYTTYHILLSYAIALEKKHDDNMLVICEDTNNVKMFVDTLQQIYSSANIKVHYLTATRNRNNIAAYLIKKNNLKRLRQLIQSDSDIDSFFYTCEWKVYTTYASYLLNQQKKEPTFFYIDDGAGTYMQQEKKLVTKSFIEKLGDKIAYGSWHRPFERQGSLNQNSILCSIFPEFLPNFYSSQNKLQISATSLSTEIDRTKFKKIFSGLFNDDIPDVLIALDDASRCTESYLSSIKLAIGKATKNANCKIAIKRHPADADNNSLLKRLQMLGNFEDLPIYIPIELYYLYFGESLKVIVGGFSTAILTACWLVPHAKVISTFDSQSLESIGNSRLLLKVFKSLDVEINCID